MPYSLIQDRVIRRKPALPRIGLARTTYTDPSFNTTIMRVSDGALDNMRSFKTPSSEECCVWSSDSLAFYTTQTGGTIRLWGYVNGVLSPREVVTFINEPTFSLVAPGLIYGARGHHIDEYDMTTKSYMTLVDMDRAHPDGIPAGSYFGGSVQSSGGSPERIACFYGGKSQDHHHFVYVFDRRFPEQRWILDTLAETIDGIHEPGLFSGGVMIHGLSSDRSGRFIGIYTALDNPKNGVVGFTQNPPNGKFMLYIWDVESGVVWPATWPMFPDGHSAYGYGVSVNKDAGDTKPYDAVQYQFRHLDDIAHPTPIVTVPMTPKMTYMGDHPNWNSAKPDVLTEFVTAFYRFYDAPDVTGKILNGVPWRAWDDEITLWMPSPGVDPYRVCHHRSDISPDNKIGATGFWYEPRPQISPDGNNILFTSNMEKTLGNDPFQPDPTMRKRTDVFLVKAR